MEKYVLREDLVVEQIGSQWLVLDQERSSVFELDGAQGRAVRAITRGISDKPIDNSVWEELEAAGIIRKVSSPGVSRRSVLRTGGLSGLVGLATLSLPQAAYASSIVSCKSYSGVLYWYWTSQEISALYTVRFRVFASSDFNEPGTYFFDYRMAGGGPSGLVQFELTADNISDEEDVSITTLTGLTTDEVEYVQIWADASRSCEVPTVED